MNLGKTITYCSLAGLLTCESFLGALVRAFFFLHEGCF